MKKILSIFILITMVISLIPMTGYAEESGEYWYAFEAEAGLLDTSVTGAFKKTAIDYDASGNYALKTLNTYQDASQSPTEMPLKFKEWFDVGGTYKIFVRIKGKGSVKYSVNGEAYKSVYSMPYKANEYSWAYLGNAEINEFSENTIAFSSRQASFYLDKIIITNSKLYYPVDNEQYKGQPLSVNNGLSMIYPVPEIKPSSTRPRVLINEERLTEISKNLTHEENIKAYNKLLSDAKRSETGILPEPASTHSGNYSVKALDCAEANALLYLLTKNEDNAKKAIDIMTNFMKTLKYNSHVKGAPIEAAGRGMCIFTASLVYDWCHDSDYFTDDKKEDMVMAIISQAEQLMCGWPPVKMSAFDNGQGFENFVIKDMLAFAIAVADEYPDIYNLVMGRVLEEYVPVVNHHYEKENMMHRMGDDYGVARFEHEVYLNMLLSAMGHPEIISEKQHLMAYQQIIRKRPDGGRLHDGDSYSSPAKADDKTLAFFTANLFEDSYLKQYFFEQMPDIDTIEHGTLDNFSNMIYLALNNPDIIRKPISDLPLSVYGGPDLGAVTARTGWEREKDSDDLVVSFKTPEIYYQSHQHLDAGHFYIYYKGALALDSGMYQSASWTDENGNKVTNLEFGSLHDYNYHKRTVAHNSMLVYDPSETSFGKYGTTNDGGQTPLYSYSSDMTAKDYTSDPGKQGEVISYSIGPDLNKPQYTYLKGDLTNWYSDKVTDYKRSFLFYNFFDDTYPGALIVFDKITSESEDFKKTWLLHSQKKPDITDNKTSFSNSGGGKLTNLTLLPKNAVYETVGDGTLKKAFMVGDTNYYAVPKSYTYDESGRYRVEISPEDKNKTDYFLNVMYVNDDNDSIPELDIKLYDTELFYGAGIRDKTAFFSKSDTLYDGKFEITIDNSENKEVTILGLKEGTWKVSQGKEEKTYNVSKGANVLDFYGVAGTYTIERVKDDYTDVSFSLFDSVSEADNPHIETAPTYFKEDNTVVVFSRSLLDKGFNITGYGVVYGESEDVTLEYEGARDFPSKTSLTRLGQFGIELIDKIGILEKECYLRTYVKYNQNGIENVVYGKAIRFN
ncbi:MAG: hypothetical protein E7419_00075 [Ruminococcaceae bacterium]|nr:hypothetical protein [Oscillospiraceae bacterium]